MKTSFRRILAATATATLTGALVFVGGGAAYAYPAAIEDVDIVVFANSNVNDLLGEVANEVTVLQSFLPQSLTEFDGGDGSAAAWTAALTDVELLVIPDPENGNFYVTGGTAWVSEGAFQVIKSWIDAGGYVIANGNYYGGEGDATYGDFLTGLTGKPFAGAPTQTLSTEVDFDLLGAVSGPDPLPWVDGTYSLPTAAWPAALHDISTVIYLSPDTTISPVLTVGVGEGVVMYLGYDWYTSAELDTAWGEVLRIATAGQLPFEPQPVYVPPVPAALADTGAEFPAAVLGFGAVLVLGGIAAVVVVRRRAA